MAENQNAVSKPAKGFAAMNPDRQREIASRGGRTAHERGVAHKWTAEEAKAAGKKGGQISGRKRSSDRYNLDMIL